MGDSVGLADPDADAEEEYGPPPLLALYCDECEGYVNWENNSATQIECGECGNTEENTQLVDINDILL